MAGPRDYTDKTIKRLFGLSRNKCSFPNCEKEMSDALSAKHSNICHIEAANEGGERWNVDMTDKQRADYDNLILLCPIHHDETNDVKKYSVEVLKEMKKRHEQEMALRVSNEKPLFKRPSLLADIISKISSIDIDNIESIPVKNSFSIDEKLKHNNVIVNKPLIQSYSIYQGKINALYTEFEKSGSNKKETILRVVNRFYLLAKGELLGAEQGLKSVQANSDKLLDLVSRKIHDMIDDSANNDSTIAYEDAEFAVSIIVVDGFMRCKILEEPENDS